SPHPAPWAPACRRPSPPPPRRRPGRVTPCQEHTSCTGAGQRARSPGPSPGPFHPTEIEMHDETRLRAFLDALWREEAHPWPDGETWREMIARVKSGGNQQVCRETHLFFLECLPPHYHGGDFFAFCEGMEALKLFARRGGTFLCRQLTWDETV